MLARFLLAVLLLSSIPAAAQTQWNSADISASVTLGASNTTATSGAAGDRGVRAVDPQTSGKYYFECQLTVQGSTHTNCGVASDYAWFPTIGSLGSYAMVVYRDGSIWRGGSNRGSVGASVGTGDWIGIAVDFTNGNFWARKNAGNWNNNGSADPSTNTGGLTLNIPSTSTLGVISASVALPLYPVAVMGANNDKVTANFGATAFAQAVPSGFTSGWSTNPITSPTGWYPNASYNSTYSGNQNLTAGGTVSSLASQVNYNRSTGKYYVEFIADRQSGTTYAVGIVNTSIFPYNVGADNNGISYVANSGIVRRNNATQATYSTWTTGDVISMAVDLDNNRIWFRKNGGDWNGSSSNDPATNTGGVDISALGKPLRPVWAVSGGPASGTDSVTGKFGYYHFSYAVPSGFTAGWPIDGPQYTLPPIRGVGAGIPIPTHH